MLPDSRFVLLIFAVRDLPKAVMFYLQAFGWKQTVDVPVYAEFEMPGGQRLGLYQKEGFARNTGQDPICAADGELTGSEIYFHVDDIKAAIARLTEAGARQLSGLSPRDWGDEAVYFADPDGNVIVLARPL